MEPDTPGDVGGYEGVLVEGKIMERMRELGFVEVRVGGRGVCSATSFAVLLLQFPSVCV
jgi:hypothetical protein